MKSMTSVEWVREGDDSVVVIDRRWVRTRARLSPGRADLGNIRQMPWLLVLDSVVLLENQATTHTDSADVAPGSRDTAESNALMLIWRHQDLAHREARRRARERAGVHVVPAGDVDEWVRTLVKAGVKLGVRALYRAFRNSGRGRARSAVSVLRHLTGR